MSLFFLKDGIIGQKQHDGSFEGGDSACWEGHRVFMGHSTTDMSFFHLGWGAHVRHPDPALSNKGFGAHYKHPYRGCISRDQLIGLILGHMRQGNYGILLMMILHHLFWGMMFSYNTIENGDDPNDYKWKWPDPIFIGTWSLYMRAFGYVSWIFWPILCVLDTWMIGEVIYANHFSKSDDQINFLGRVFASQEFVPTPTAYVARKILNKNKMKKFMNLYWCGWRRNCGMVDLFSERIDAL